MSGPVTKLERVREVALDQHGYVTTAQAVEEGLAYPEIAVMAKRGRLAHVAHGVYRVSQVRDTQYDEYQLALLWTGVSEAYLSHDTALHAWDLCDINPERIHLTVPRSKRIRRSGGDQYVIHHEAKTPANLSWWQGMSIVDVPTAIRQGIDTGVPTYLIKQALDAAKTTGRLTPDERKTLTTLVRDRDTAA